MRTSDFSYTLPPELIADKPSDRREDARLLVVDRASGTWEHRRFSDITSYSRPGDLWVFNNSRVFPARVECQDSIEALLLEETSPHYWLCLTQPGKKTKIGAMLNILSRDPSRAGMKGQVLRVLESGERVIRFDPVFDINLDGHVPLPPYIEKRRAALGGTYDEASDFERYQTVYAAKAGSVAAPTAGLHFTPEILAALPHDFVTLHVGLGTFRPIKTEFLEDHEMHEEKFEVTASAAKMMNEATRIVSVGTTTARTLESLPTLQGMRSRTKIFIKPGYQFRHTQALLTNFHLPHSTLLALVGAFLGQSTSASLDPDRGMALLHRVYEEAVRERYRFFSYGDAMLIL